MRLIVPSLLCFDVLAKGTFKLMKELFFYYLFFQTVENRFLFPHRSADRAFPMLEVEMCCAVRNGNCEEEVNLSITVYPNRGRPS